MSGGPSIQYKFTQQGLQDLTSRIKALHEEFRDGAITYKQYKSEIREASSQGRAATQEFNQMKGAIAAANPQLLNYTRTMSTFGSVANTVLGVTNAINLAQMASMGIDKTVMQDRVDLAAATNQAAKDLAAFGPNSAQYKTDLEKMDALTNKMKYDQQQMAYQSISTSATLVASGVAIASNLSQTAMGFMALRQMMSPQLAENFAIGLLAVRNAAITLLGPIALVATVITGIYYAYRALSPEFAQETDEIYNGMIKNWHLDTLTATLLAPFVSFAIGVVQIGNRIHQDLAEMYNSILSDTIYPLANAWNDTIGNITGRVTRPGFDMYKMPSDQSVISSFGLGSDTGTTAAGQSLQQTSEQQLQQQILTGNNTAQILEAQRQQGASLTAANSNLVTIHTSISPLNDSITAGTAATTGAISSGTDSTVSAINTLGTTITSANQAQTAALQSAMQQALQSNLQQQQSLQQQISALETTLPSVQAADTSYSGFGHTPLENYYNTLNSLKSQLNQLKNNATNIIANGTVQGVNTSGFDLGGLGINQANVATQLNSLLSNPAGIPSVSGNSFGGSGGEYGSPMTAATFAVDNGALTLAARGAGIAQTALQNEVNRAVQNIQNSGINTSSYFGFSPAASYGAPYGGLAGMRAIPDPNSSTGIKLIPAATGLDGIISSPTHILAGEAGPEQVSITPLSRGGGGKGITNNIYITIQGSLLSDNTLAKKIDDVMKGNMKSGGFT